MRPLIYAFAAVLLSSSTIFAQDIQPVPEAAATPAVTPAPAAPPGNPAPTGPMVVISTSMGDITIQLYSVRAPKGAANFLRYVREKHFDGTSVYRVAPGYVVQMGSFLANGSARASHTPIALEANNGLSNLHYAVAYAHSDKPGDGGQAEFFINLRDNTGLDQAKDDIQNKTGYAVFGQVVAGMDVVDRIAVVPVGDHGPMPGEAPVTPIVIKKVSLVPETK
jgi:peptidyl-prolyl cis-trans isomerase A (cyclophilin A)